MGANEYQDFIADPTAFWLKPYLPRAYDAFGPLSMLPDFPRISDSVDTIDLLLPFGMPDFQEKLHKMMEAGNELMKTMGEVGQTGAMFALKGFPGMGLNIVKTLFDNLGDTLRGTKGILLEMFPPP